MKLFLAILFASLCLASTFSVDTKLKRSKRSDFFEKVKTGLKTAGNTVAGYAQTGYEEVKNVFSKDRKFGDYRVNQFDVRFGEDELNTTTTESSDNVEKLNLENINSMNSETKTESVKTKRSIAPLAALREADLVEIDKDISASASTSTSSE